MTLQRRCLLLAHVAVASPNGGLRDVASDFLGILPIQCKGGEGPS